MKQCLHCNEEYTGSECWKCGSMEVECGNCEAEVSCDRDGKPHRTSGEGGGAFFAPGTPAQAVWCFECLDNYDGAPDDLDYDAGPSLSEQCDRAWQEKRG